MSDTTPTKAEQERQLAELSAELRRLEASYTKMTAALESARQDPDDLQPLRFEVTGEDGRTVAFELPPSAEEDLLKQLMERSIRRSEARVEALGKAMGSPLDIFRRRKA